MFREVLVPARFDGRELDARYRLDLLVEGRVVVEAKACSEVQPVHRAQLLTYLRMTEAKVGLLLNVHEARLIDGVNRLIL